VKGRLPRLSAMTRTIQNRRRKQRVEPPLPSHRKDIVLLPEYTVTDSGENFLLFDSGPVEKRILVFGTSNNLELLSNSQIWFADGTFKHVPLLFYQLYTIHVFKGGKAIPVLYALLPDKKRKTYLEFLRAIVTLKPSLKPKIISRILKGQQLKHLLQYFLESNNMVAFFTSLNVFTGESKELVCRLGMLTTPILPSAYDSWLLWLTFL